MKKNFLLMALILIGAGLRAQAQPAAPSPDKVLGIYVHQHWAYNHPYAARTWTLKDWRGYLDGIKRLGYNMVVIWPMLENMPDPLTPSDEAHIAKIAEVIAMAHRDYQLGAYIVLCPNVSSRDDEARKYTFEKRPFFATDGRVDPADPVAFGRLIARRETLMRPLAATDGILIIDSDPGGYPHSTNAEFVYILGAHRRMLDRLRPGIEVMYWSHFGWESYSKFYSTGELKRGTPAEAREAVALLARSRMEPWGIANSGFPADFVDEIGQGGRVMSFAYGAIESEPAFPFTLFGGDRAYQGSQRPAARGVIGNAQTHAIQLPNTFAFARGARGLSTLKADYIGFANDLIPGQGELIVEGWEALQGDDVVRSRAAAGRLNQLSGEQLRGGSLQGLLFGDARRFVRDIVLQLLAKAAVHEFKTAVNQTPADPRRVRETLATFVVAVEAWQTQHGYSNHWIWPDMQESLRKLGSEPVNATLDTLVWVSEEGATPFDRVKNGLARLETYSPRLIAAMKQALADMDRPK